MIRKRPPWGTPFPHLRGHGMACGPTSVAMILRYWGLPDLTEPLIQLADVTTAGANMETLGRAAQRFGFEPAYYQAQFDELPALDTPFIAHVKGNHFVVVYGVNSRGVHIADPLADKTFQSKKAFCADWDGIVMTLTPLKGFDDPFVSQTIKSVLAREKAVRARYGKWFRQHFLQLAMVLPAAILIPLCLLAPLPLLRDVVDHSAPPANIPSLLWWALLPLAYGVGQFFKGMASAAIDRDLGGTLTRAFFFHLAHLPQAFFDNHRNEDLLLRVQENEAIRRFISESPHVLVSNLFLAMACVLMLGAMEPILAPMFTTLILTYLMVVRLFDAKLKELIAKQRGQHARVVVAFLDMLHGIHTLKLLAGEPEALAAWEQKQNQSHTTIWRGQRMRHALQGLLGVISGLVYVTGGLLLLRPVNGVGLSPGSLVAGIFLFALYAHAMQQLLDLWLRYRAFLPALASVHNIFLQEREDKGSTPDQSPAAGLLEVENAVFRYQSDQEYPVVNQFSVTIRPGEKIGIVGGNGSGKSTLLKLLVGLYHLDQGAIRLDGTDISRMDPIQLRKRVFLFPQDVYVFDDSMGKNIAYGKGPTEENQILAAAKAAGLFPVIDGLFYGLEHRIGNMGTSALSGGQRLKLGFARLFLSDPDIIILDEASSALDVAAEAAVMQHLYEHFAHKTIIAVTHRFKTLELVDRILVLEQGRLTGDGNHQSLLEEDGPYRHFVNTIVSEDSHS